MREGVGCWERDISSRMGESSGRAGLCLKKKSEGELQADGVKGETTWGKQRGLGEGDGRSGVNFKVCFS